MKTLLKLAANNGLKVAKIRFNGIATGYAIVKPEQFNTTPPLSQTYCGLELVTIEPYFGQGAYKWKIKQAGRGLSYAKDMKEVAWKITNPIGLPEYANIFASSTPFIPNPYEGQN